MVAEKKSIQITPQGFSLWDKLEFSVEVSVKGGLISVLAGSNIHGAVGCQPGYHTIMDHSYLRVSNFVFRGWVDPYDH